MRQLRPILGLLLFSLLALAKDKPDIKEREFSDAPVNILYFEDSDIVLTIDKKEGKAYRSEDGGAKWTALEEGEKDVIEMLKHPYDKQTAVMIGRKKEHWITHDRGEKWKQFKSDEEASRARPAIEFHADDPKRMIFHAEKCEFSDLFCSASVHYTTDGFESGTKLLSQDVANCIWAKNTDIFTSNDADIDKNQIFCIAKGKFAHSKPKVVLTKDFFETGPKEPEVGDGRTVDGVTHIAAVKKYLVFAAKSSNSDEMAMYVSNDSKSWHRAEFGEHKLEEDAYTLLESTNYSMQVDVMTTRPTSPMGVLLTSNSNGTFFSRNIEHTNRNMRGFVDFEKVSNIQGIVIVNTVANWEQVEKDWMVEKKIKSQISFDDGRDFEDLTYDKKKLHLHSVTQQRNIGRIFSSPAPGIVMGVGNTGDYLGDYLDGDLYVSSDAGLTWTKALDEPHIYEFGAQGSVLVAIKDSETDVISWSLNYGEKWESTKLDDKIKPLALVTTPDSTSLRFLIIASRGTSRANTKYFTIALDFDGLHEDECKDKDFEKWPARVDDDGKPICIMGHIQKFKRRKAGSKCVVKSKHFEDPEEERETCECTEKDFECDFNFKPENGTCNPIAPIRAPDGACDDNQKSFEGPSGYRKIPGNDCKGGTDLTKPTDRDCTDTLKPPVSGDISNEITNFDGRKFLEYYYLERGDIASGEDETIVMHTDEDDIWVTHDHGKRWYQPKALKGEKIQAVYPHQYNSDRVYMITSGEKVYYSTDRLQTEPKYFNAPIGPNRDRIQVLSYHPDEKDWLIWTGSQHCSSNGCETVAHVSTKHGEGWSTLLKGVRKCLFVYSEDRKGKDAEKLVYCEQHEDENRNKPLHLVSSKNWFENKEELKRDVINFATMAEYIVVALHDEEQKTLKVDASIDGETFADARFPKNFKIAHQRAYTVLDSSTHAIFLHVTVNGERDSEYGSILKSNSNGTSYVLSASEVNRNEDGYVDFEKMQGLEGVAIINRVSNHKETDSGKEKKKLKTYITHNDGADWALISRPTDDKKYPCNGKIEQCSLHLHGYTERKDPRDSYSSPSAVGLMIGTGNVGEYLGLKREANTFITRDGGVTWRFAAEGNWMWEYGDRGSIIVIVKEDETTDVVKYTLDEGETWIEYNFGEKMVVSDITTVPSDTSRNFLLWGKIGSKISTINLDFSGLKERSESCKLDEQNPKADDYDLWSPKHPLSDDNCLFGHVAEYHRKRLDRDCYNGRMPEDLHSVAKNCTCSVKDFECDYNYERQGDGTCTLIQGMEKPDPKAVCEKNPDLTEYHEITGYRRIPLSTCSGGKELDYTSKVQPCPGKEEDFNRKHGISGVGLFFAIVLPIAAAAGIGYWVWKNWDGKFGRIRLGDGMGGIGGPGSAFDGDAPWVKYPVMAVSGVIAVIAAIPMLVGSIWRTASTRFGRSSGYARPYTSRSSFQRGRGDYSFAEPDEGELLGDDSDDDV